MTSSWQPAKSFRTRSAARKHCSTWQISHTFRWGYRMGGVGAFASSPLGMLMVARLKIASSLHPFTETENWHDACQPVTTW